MRRLSQLAARFRTDDNGVVTVEFLFIFPLFLTLFLSLFEIGFLMTKQAMLDRGVDIAVRAIRLSNGDVAITHDAIKEMICDEALILRDCEDQLQLELVEIPSDSWTFPASTADCIDRESEVEPVVSFVAGQENEIMFVRACVLIDPMFPSSGFGAALSKDASGAYQMISTAAFANEPN